MFSLDLSSYLNRVGYGGQLVPTLRVLRELHWLHPKAIAFENLDVLLNRPIRLDIESLSGKLIEQRRGGYCYEQNTLFAAALNAIGFSVSSLGARVMWRYPESSVRPRSHMLLRVRLPEADYIADVGFGLLTLTAPLRLEAGMVQATPHGEYRLVSLDREIRVEAKSREGWSPVYQFSMREESSADWEVYNWYTSTHPDSRFTRELMVARPEDGVRFGLLNNVLTTYHLDGRAERKVVAPNELPALLHDIFAIDFPAQEVNALTGFLRSSEPA